MTNDDGVESAGSAALATRLRQSGHEVLESYPSVNASGCGTAIWPLGHQAQFVDGRAISWTPAFIVNYWLDNHFVPDLVVSGVNDGPNVGTSILHSGTVAAVLAAGARGFAGVAISCDDRYSTFGEEDGEVDWEAMAALGLEAIEFTRVLRDDAMWNINIPAQPSLHEQSLELTVVEFTRPQRVLSLDHLEGPGTAYVRPTFNEDESEEIGALRRGEIAITCIRDPFGFTGQPVEGSG